MLMMRPSRPSQKDGRQDLHVAGQHDHVGLFLRQDRLHLLEGRRLRGRLRADGHAPEADAVPLHQPPQVLVVRDHARDVALELPAAPAVQEVGHAVVLLAREQHHPLRHVGVAQPPVHGELRRHRLEGGRQLPRAEPLGRLSATISIRRKNRSVARSPCCAASSTDPPCPAISPVTAATMPTRSGQVMVRM